MVLHDCADTQRAAAVPEEQGAGQHGRAAVRAHGARHGRQPPRARPQPHRAHPQARGDGGTMYTIKA